MMMYVGVFVALLVTVIPGQAEEDHTPGQAEEVHTPDQEGEVHTPALMVAVSNGTGFDISIPEAGKEMIDFRYFISFNTELTEVKELYCKGRVECISPKSKFKLHKNREMKEGDTLYFYLIGYRKPENFQMERVYEVKKNEEGDLEFQEKSSRASLEKEGFWYEHNKLDKLPETDP